MKRRTILGLFAALAFAPTILFAGDNVDYTPGLIKSELAAGKTVFVDYAADWCSTCKRQERVINDLRAKNPKYDENITFIRVDWDDFSSEEVTTSRNVPRRSTLLVLKGEEELGRIIAGTDTGEIQALLDTAL